MEINIENLENLPKDDFCIRSTGDAAVRHAIRRIFEKYYPEVDSTMKYNSTNAYYGIRRGVAHISCSMCLDTEVKNVYSVEVFISKHKANVVNNNYSIY